MRLQGNYMSEDLIVQEAKKRFQAAADASREFRTQAREDLNFYDGVQWIEGVKAQRDQAGIPAYTYNMLPAIIRTITNDMRANKPAIQVDPSGAGTRDTADLYAALIRGIEASSFADTAYDKAAEYAVICGIGYIRIGSEYDNNDNDDQNLLIKAVYNPLMVYYDPLSTDQAGADAEYCFIVTDMPKEEYKRKYGTSQLATAMEYSGNGADWTHTPDDTSVDSWIAEDTVRVAEYYYKEYTKETLYKVQLETGEILFAPKKPPANINAVILSSREIQKVTVKWCIINSAEILSETIWPGEHIPVVPVKGIELWVGQQRRMSGAVRDMKDSQRNYNWSRSYVLQTLALAPQAPWIGAKGQFQGMEELWRDANVSGISYLEYEPKESNGSLIGPPVRQTFEPPVQAMSASAAASMGDLKAISGVYAAAVGAPGNEISGEAILARTTQSKLQQSHYYDNLVKSISQVGRILVNVIPSFYDTERVVRIIGIDNVAKNAPINTPDPQTGNVKNDLSVGRYDVVVEAGPSYATMRQEAATTMQEFVKSNPAAWPVIGDLVVGAMDWPDAQLVAKRLKAVVPPEVLAATGEDDHSQMEPAAKSAALLQQNAQLKMAVQKVSIQNEALQAELKQATEEIKLTTLRNQVDILKVNKNFEYKMAALDVDKDTAIAEFQLKVEELEQSQEQIDIKREQLRLSAASMAHTVNMDDITRHDNIDRLRQEALQELQGVKMTDPELGGKLGRSSVDDSEIDADGDI